MPSCCVGVGVGQPRRMVEQTQEQTPQAPHDFLPQGHNGGQHNAGSTASAARASAARNTSGRGRGRGRSKPPADPKQRMLTSVFNGPDHTPHLAVCPQTLKQPQPLQGVSQGTQQLPPMPPPHPTMAQPMNEQHCGGHTLFGPMQYQHHTPQSSLHEVHELPRSVPIGMRNLGSTCYLNATMQCLASLPPFTLALLAHQRVSQGPLPQDRVTAAVLQVQHVVAQLHAGKDQNVSSSLDSRALFDALHDADGELTHTEAATVFNRIGVMEDASDATLRILELVSWCRCCTTHGTCSNSDMQCVLCYRLHLTLHLFT